MQSLTGKITGSSLTAAEWNQLPQEVQNLIVDLGMSLSSGDLDQLGKAVAMMSAASQFYTAAGTDTIALTSIGSRQGPDDYIDGLLIRFRPANSNTGAVTVNVNSKGAKDLKRESGSALIAGNLNTLKDVVARYDSSSGDFFLLEHSLANPVLASPRGYIDGLILSNGSTPDEYVDISIGQCRDAANAANIINAAAIGKDITAVATTGGTPGSPTGGYPSGMAALAADTWYHVLYITDGINATCGFDLSISGANLIADHSGSGGADLSGYTSYRRLGSVLTDATADILKFYQYGDRFMFDVHIKDVALTDPGTSEVVHTLSLPTGIKFCALVVIKSSHSSTSQLLYSGGDTDLSGRTVDNSDHHQHVGANAGVNSHFAELLTNTSAQIKTKQTVASADLDIWLEGWIDLRGQNV